MVVLTRGASCRTIIARCALVAMVTVLLGGCAMTPPPGGQEAGTLSDRVVPVVAAEDMWGSLAAQVGGVHARVISVIANPATDPHAYEPSAADARRLADARLVVANGAGYDPWMQRLLSAAGGTRTVLDVGNLMGVPAGANPHLWYWPAAVDATVSKLAADLAALDPGDANYFRQQGRHVATVVLADYHAALAGIRDRFGGRPVAASESLAFYLCRSTGLDLITPPALMRAVSEGTEPSPADRATATHQLGAGTPWAFLENTQNLTPDVQGMAATARSAGIPVVALTETVVPAGATFQAWQTRQLGALARALGSHRAGTLAHG